MKVMSWNVWGLNSSCKQDILSNFVRDHKLDIMLVNETKMSKDRVESLSSLIIEVFKETIHKEL